MSDVAVDHRPHETPGEALLRGAAELGLSIDRQLRQEELVDFEDIKPGDLVKIDGAWYSVLTVTTERSLYLQAGDDVEREEWHDVPAGRRVLRFVGGF